MIDNMSEQLLLSGVIEGGGSPQWNSFYYRKNIKPF